MKRKFRVLFYIAEAMNFIALLIVGFVPFYVITQIPISHQSQLVGIVWWESIVVWCWLKATPQVSDTLGYHAPKREPQ